MIRLCRNAILLWAVGSATAAVVYPADCTPTAIIEVQPYKIICSGATTVSTRTRFVYLRDNAAWQRHHCAGNLHGNHVVPARDGHPAGGLRPSVYHHGDDLSAAVNLPAAGCDDHGARNLYGGYVMPACHGHPSG
ncbi:hypothetical protein ISF_02199 [Cordyceps fumosorosea ARSEF 2679]|uniref:Uncharacterized protein n=1 Tax=Cordyceps fumosorosea (strain ARSEF 2679) TaxID=1081104 RepID=A0A168CPY7_CORFA|nr:hypothetical protein ISF_02199 [Cordyceps fumosorosea ARSEF 2679]OAA71648.1 hypothetical protein ISF_02199 [Cordyceps fumosorosea ARSEF 2679]